MQQILVALVVLLSAAYVAGRLLPARLIERLLQASIEFAPRLAPSIRAFAGRKAQNPGAVAAGCASCPARNRRARRSTPLLIHQ